MVVIKFGWKICMFFFESPVVHLHASSNKCWYIDWLSCEKNGGGWGQGDVIPYGRMFPRKLGSNG